MKKLTIALLVMIFVFTLAFILTRNYYQQKEISSHPKGTADEFLTQQEIDGVRQATSDYMVELVSGKAVTGPAISNSSDKDDAVKKTTADNVTSQAIMEKTIETATPAVSENKITTVKEKQQTSSTAIQKDNFYLRLAAFDKKTNAANYAAKMKRKGYSVQVAKGASGRYNVLLSKPYNNKNDALAGQQYYSSKKINTVIVWGLAN